jgi:hypothetical protein
MGRTNGPNLWVRFWIWVVGILAPSLLVIPPESLDDDECQCSHDRCYHTKGIGKCQLTTGITLRSCGCQMFVKKGRGRESDFTPSPDDLQKMYQLK